MPRQTDIKLSRFEFEVMKILWELEEATVRQVQEAIEERDRPAYTTVQTIIARLEEKGAARRGRKIGNAFLYFPTITRKSAYRNLIDNFLGLFGGSPEPVISYLIDSGKLTLEDLKAMEADESGPTAEEAVEASEERGGK